MTISGDNYCTHSQALWGQQKAIKFAASSHSTYRRTGSYYNRKVCYFYMYICAYVNAIIKNAMHAKHLFYCAIKNGSTVYTTPSSLQALYNTRPLPLPHQPPTLQPCRSTWPYATSAMHCTLVRTYVCTHVSVC